MVLAPTYRHNFIAFHKSKEECKQNYELGVRISLENEFLVKRPRQGYRSGKYVMQLTIPSHSIQFNLALNSESKMTMEQWYQTLILLLSMCTLQYYNYILHVQYFNYIGCHHVDLVRCHRFPYLEGEYVIEVCRSSYKIWPVNKTKFGWIWQLKKKKKIWWHPYATKLEVTVGRYICFTILPLIPR